MNESFQKTKIVATVGPAIDSYDQLKELILAGVDVFRLNFSQGSQENHQRVIDTIHQLKEELGTYVSILADLQGPKIRIGQIENETMSIEPEQIIELNKKALIDKKNQSVINKDQHQ